MKFNFEKNKENTKKIIIGAGVVASSLANLEAQEVKPNLIEKEKEETEVVFDITQNDSEQYRDEYLKYMEHPSYKKRLAKEMYGDEVIDEEKQKFIDREYNERKSQLKTVPIKINELRNPIGDFNPLYDRKHNIVSTNKEAAFHEISHSIDMRTSKSDINDGEEGFIYEKNKLIHEDNNDDLGGLLSEVDKLQLEKSKEKKGNKDYEEYNENYKTLINILNKYIDDNKNNSDFKENHPDLNLLNKEINSNNITIKKILKIFSNSSEQLFLIKNNRDLFQKIQDYDEKFNQYEQKIDKLKESFNYLNRDTEIRARLNHLRIKAVKEYNFDLNNEFNIDNFKELKNDIQYIQLKDHLGFSDEQINELMKYTADNIENNNSKGTYVHPGWDYSDKDNKA